jgi:elongator complex protein 3
MEKIILQLIATKAQDRTLELLTTFKRDFSKKNNLPDLPSNIQLLQAYYTLLKAKKINKDSQIEQLLKKRAIRSQSGIVSVQVLTKPFYCPGQCIFCPNDPTMPKSYIKSEPGAMRALLNKFDPIKQVYNRLLSLTLTGHETDKIELIVLG